MKKLVFWFMMVVSNVALAWTIGPMNYQGRLLDNAGIPVTGSYNFTVSIYDALTGGTLKYSEQQNSIAVDDGVYSFLVSTGTNPTGTWDINLWNTPTLYMEIAVNGQTLTPRQLLASAPFAYQANLALTTNNALALGGKSSGAVLKDICKTSKGKWLDIAQKCLGVGSSFPGPTRVLWSTLSSDSNFSGLDLSNADISGIDFSGANLNSSIFNQTIYSVQGVVSAALGGTRWNGAVATDAVAVAIPQDTELEDVQMQNMSLSKWNLSGAQILGWVSMGNLTGCPAAPPSGWQCIGTSPNFYLLGPGVFVGKGSLFVASNDAPQIPLDNLNIPGANFSEDMIDYYVSFHNTDISGAYFYGAHITSTKFDNTNIDNLSCSFCRIERTIFTRGVTGAYFGNARLEYVRFDGSVSGLNFNNATLIHVVFTQPVTNVDFSNAVLDGVIFAGGSGTVSTGARLFGGTVLPP